MKPPELNPELNSYTRFLVACSGGKDSVALLLHLLDLGVPREKIEIHHHLVDGDNDDFFDWPCTEGYVRAIANHFGIPVYFSWREGGFRREMLRENQCTGAVYFQTPEGETVKTGGNNGTPNTRRKFPQVSASLTTRWCSSVLKISVMDTLIRNSPRFYEGKTLVLTGERAEESAARAKYALFEPHRTHTKTESFERLQDSYIKNNPQRQRKTRHVDHWRPLLRWTTKKVWNSLEKHRILPHPAYWLGFGRCSCAFCIFLPDDDLSLLNAIAPSRIREITDYEREFDLSISRSRRTVADRAASQSPRTSDPFWAETALSKTWALPVVLPDSIPWIAPSGAFSSLKGGSP